MFGSKPPSKCSTSSLSIVREVRLAGDWSLQLEADLLSRRVSNFLDLGLNLQSGMFVDGLWKTLVESALGRWT